MILGRGPGGVGSGVTNRGIASFGDNDQRSRLVPLQSVQYQVLYNQISRYCRTILSTLNIQPGVLLDKLKYQEY